MNLILVIILLIISKFKSEDVRNFGRNIVKIMFFIYSSSTVNAQIYLFIDINMKGKSTINNAVFFGKKCRKHSSFFTTL